MTLKDRLSVLRPTLAILQEPDWKCLTIYAIVIRRSGYGKGQRHVRFFISEAVDSMSDVTFEVATWKGCRRCKDGTIQIGGEDGATLIAGLSKDFFDDYKKIPFVCLVS